MRARGCRWSHDQRARLDDPHRKGSRGTTVPVFLCWYGSAHTGHSLKERYQHHVEGWESGRCELLLRLRESLLCENAIGLHRVVEMTVTW